MPLCRRGPSLDRLPCAPSGDFLDYLLANVEVLKCFVFVTNVSSVYKGLKERRRSSMGGIARGLIRHMACVETPVLSPSDGTYGALLLHEWFFGRCFTNLRSVALPNCLLVQDIARRSQCLLPSTLREVQIQFTISVEYYEKSDQANIAREEDIATVEWLVEANLVSLQQLNRVILWYQPCELDGPEMYLKWKGIPFMALFLSYGGFVGVSATLMSISSGHMCGCSRIHRSTGG